MKIRKKKYGEKEVEESKLGVGVIGDMLRNRDFFFGLKK